MDKFQKNKYRFSSTQPLILIGNDIVEARNEQVNQLVSELIKYKVLIRDLVNSEVDYSKRNELLTIAMFIINNFELYDAFVKNEDVPIDVLHRFTRVDKKFLQKYREYIVAYTLIFGNPIYKNIQDYVQIVENSIEDEEEKNKKEIIKKQEEIEELTQKLDKGLLDIDTSTSERAIGLKRELTPKRRIKSKLCSKIAVLDENINYKFSETTESFEQLKKFFPDANVKIVFLSLFISLALFFCFICYIFITRKHFIAIE